MSSANSSHKKYRRKLGHSYRGLPPQLPSDDDGTVVAKIETGLMNIVPIFLAGGRQFATSPQLATVLSITGFYDDVNPDDVANALKSLGADWKPQNGKAYFNLRTVTQPQDQGGA